MTVYVLKSSTITIKAEEIFLRKAGANGRKFKFMYYSLEK